MKITLDDKFKNSLDNILDFIALDSLNQSKKFNRDLFKQIYKIPDMPYKFRKSIHFNDENIRDLVFKGYTVPYLIDDEVIVVLGIVKYMEVV